MLIAIAARVVGWSLATRGEENALPVWAGVCVFTALVAGASIEVPENAGGDDAAIAETDAGGDDEAADESLDDETDDETDDATEDEGGDADESGDEDSDDA